MWQLIGSIAFMYLVVGSAAMWYRSKTQSPTHQSDQTTDPNLAEA